MPLDYSVSALLMTYSCPHCTYAVRRRGSWFKSIARYRCPNCEKHVQMGYEAKAALFDSYVRSSKKAGQDRTALSCLTGEAARAELKKARLSCEEPGQVKARPLEFEEVGLPGGSAVGGLQPVLQASKTIAATEGGS